MSIWIPVTYHKFRLQAALLGRYLGRLRHSSFAFDLDRAIRQPALSINKYIRLAYTAAFSLRFILAAPPLIVGLNLLAPVLSQRRGARRFP